MTISGAVELNPSLIHTSWGEQRRVHCLSILVSRPSCTFSSHTQVQYTASDVWTELAPPYYKLYTFATGSSSDAYYELDYRTTLNDGYQDYIEHCQDWAHSIGTEYSHQPAYNLPIQMVSCPKSFETDVLMPYS